MSVNVLVFSDVHCHQWQEHDHPDRWQDCIKAVHDVRVLCAQLKPDLVVFTGDLFESKRILRSNIVTAAYKEMASTWTCRNDDGSVRIVPAVYVAGNHDYYMDSCTLDMLKSNTIRVVSKHSMGGFRTTLNGHTFAFIPNGLDTLPNELIHTAERGLSAVFTHADITGAKVSRAIESKRTGISPAFTCATPIARTVINGHYHHPQILNLGNGVNAYMVGSLLQHNWTDADSQSQRGAHLFTFHDDGSHDSDLYPVGDKYPKFYKAQTTGSRPIDFVMQQPTMSVSVDTKVHDADAIAKVAVGSSEQIAFGYLKHVMPNISGSDLAEYFKAGINCLTGGSDETA